MKRSSLHILVAGCVLAVYAVASTMDFEDEQREFDHYCNMVEEGHWPDYKDSADDCSNVNDVRVSKDIGNKD